MIKKDSEITKLRKEVKDLRERLERVEQSTVAVTVVDGVLRPAGDGFTTNTSEPTKLRAAR